MPNPMKAKREAMIQEAIAREPRIVAGKKFLLTMCIVFLAARLALVAVETAFVLAHGLSSRIFIMDGAMLLVACLFALGIYRMGFKELAYLAMLGGVISIWNMLKDDPSAFFQSLQIGSTFYKVYAFSMLATMLIQILSMVLIVSNGDCKVYFAQSKRITKAVADQLAKESPGRRLS